MGSRVGTDTHQGAPSSHQRTESTTDMRRWVPPISAAPLHEFPAHYTADATYVL